MTTERERKLETQAAIYCAASNANLRRETSRALLSILPTPGNGKTWPFDSWPPMPDMARALETVLGRVRMHERARGDLMTALLIERRSRAWRGPGEERHRYSPDTEAQGDCRVCGHTYAAHRETGAI